MTSHRKMYANTGRFLLFHQSECQRLNVSQQQNCYSNQVYKCYSARINLCWCTVEASNKPLAMNNWVCHSALRVRLLVLPMFRGDSFAAPEIFICKDEELSVEAARLLERYLYRLTYYKLILFIATFWHSIYFISSSPWLVYTPSYRLIVYLFHFWILNANMQTFRCQHGAKCDV